MAEIRSDQAHISQNYCFLEEVPRNLFQKTIILRYSENFKSNGPLFQKKYSGKEKYFFKINQFVCSGGKIFIHKLTFYLPIFQIQKNFQNKIMPLSRYIEKLKKIRLQTFLTLFCPFLPFFALFCPLFSDSRILFKF